jgi:hypothetical protein
MIDSAQRGTGSVEDWRLLRSDKRRAEEILERGVA